MNIPRLCLVHLRSANFHFPKSISNRKTLHNKDITYNNTLGTKYKLKTNNENLDIKKKSRPKKSLIHSSDMGPGYWNVVAFSSAESYKLNTLCEDLKHKNLYAVSELTSDKVLMSEIGGAVHTIAKYQITSENRHIYYFEDGSVVLWNMPEMEQRSIIEFLKPHEENSYETSNVIAEVETMPYCYNAYSKRTVIKDGIIIIGTLDKTAEDIAADRYTLSNAMALSAKLGIFELILDKYIDEIEYLTKDLEFGNPVRLNRRAILRKIGQLFALRHSINLSTDLLDVPDFYWEREHLETLYCSSCQYFSIPKRTKVLNEKLNNCSEVTQLISSHLNDQHHIKLEWMIIVLIAIEIIFEFKHLF